MLGNLDVDISLEEKTAKKNESVFRNYVRRILSEGRYEAETTKISRDVVNWVKENLSKGLPQDEVSKYKRDYPYHNLGIKMFDVPPSGQPSLA